MTVASSDFLSLSRGFDRGHTDCFAGDATGDLHLLTGKLTGLLLSGPIELINNLAIPVRENELSVLCTHQRAVLLIHAGHMLQTAGTITDVANHGSIRCGLGACFLSHHRCR